MKDEAPERIDRETAQAQIEGLLVSRMLLDFFLEFRDTYGRDVLPPGVGPMQSFLGWAMIRGYISRAPSPAPDVRVTEEMVERLEEAACWELHREAAATLRAQAAEIERLQEARDLLTIEAEEGEEVAGEKIATAYARGLDDAAQVADKLNGWGPDCGSGGHAEHIAAAIRALAPDSE